MKICEPKVFNMRDLDHQFIPECLFFNLPDYIMENLQAMNDAYKSVLFRDHWMTCAQRACRLQHKEQNKNIPLILEAVIQNVWTPSFKRYRHILFMLVII